MKLVWSNTGDEIVIVPSNQEFCDYYVNMIQDRNMFVCNDQQIQETHISAYHQCLDKVLQALTRLGVPHAFELGSAFDQTHLNRQHSAWVAVQQQYPAIAFLLGDHAQHWHALNKTIHACEEMWQQTWTNVDTNWLAPNPYTRLLDFNHMNVRLCYADLGRSTFNKFLNYDKTGPDTSDYNYLPGQIMIDLGRPLEYMPPQNYVAWCQQQGLDHVPGAWLSLGNLIDLEYRLSDYRQILFRNQTNTMSVKN